MVLDAATKMNAFPVFMRVEGRVIVIVGAGEEALAKARLVGRSSAGIKIIAARPVRGLAEWASRSGASLIRQDYDAAHLEGAALVFAATGTDELDRRIVSEARAAGIPVNAVDRPELCDFFTPALVDRAPVVVAVGTEGMGPVLAQKIRSRIDAMLPPALGRLARLAGSLRSTVENRLPPGPARRTFWHAFFEGHLAQAADAGMETARRAAMRLLDDPREARGHVALVGAGPGAPDLLTIRAHRVLMEADCIVHDALVPQAVVDMGRRDAERIEAGKRKGCHSRSQLEINDLLVRLARQGKRVVRLKSGDPLVFGRGGEEMQALREAAIPYEIVPGVTAACASAADFELPLTLRGVASSLVFTTGHDLRGESLPDWSALAIGGATVAIYMGRTNAADIAGRLIDAGLACDTAVAVIENASLRERRLFHGVLSDLPLLQARDDLRGPVLTLIGDAIAAADLSESEPLARKGRAPVHAMENAR